MSENLTNVAWKCKSCGNVTYHPSADRNAKIELTLPSSRWGTRVQAATPLALGFEILTDIEVHSVRVIFTPIGPGQMFRTPKVNGNWDS